LFQAMAATIRVNGLTLAHKGTGGFARSTLPDVCKSPVAPVPYVNVSYISTLQKGTRTVHADGGNMIATKGSEQATSIGDEPGVGLGVKSGTQLHRATWLSWSPDVFMEGRPVNRLTDKMLMNNGNTVCLAGHWDPKVEGATSVDLCKEACECVVANAGADKPKLDACFAKRLRDKGYNPQTNRPTPQTLSNGTLSNAAYILQAGEWILKMSRKEPDMPSNGRPSGSRIPDATQMADGKPVDIYEMNSRKDDWAPGQENDYKKIANANGGKLTKIEVDKQCDCDGYKKEKEAKEAEATQDAAQRALAGAAMKYIAKKAMKGPVGELETIWDLAKEVFTVSPAY
jgi:hypothetical protein